jgi:hypothetical protein
MNANAEFFELRSYRIERGRSADMRSRVVQHLRGLFETHGIPMVQCWDCERPGAEEFVYLVKWDSWAQRLSGWGGFYADPRWHAARAETNAGSELVERMDVRFLQAFVRAASGPAGDSRLVFLRVKIGQLQAARQLLLGDFATAAAQCGAAIVAAFEVMAGNDLPQLAVIVQGESATAIEALVRELPQPSPLLDASVLEHNASAFRELNATGRRHLAPSGERT